MIRSEGPRRPGLTLLEVVIVFTIFGVLTALLLPAILRVRDRSNQVRCAAKLKKIGFAAFQYHDNHRMLPPGHLGPKPNGGYPYPGSNAYGFQQVGCLTFLLPYLDMGHLYRRLETNFSPRFPPDGGRNGIAYWMLPNDWSAAQAKLDVFNCPADSELYDRLSGSSHGVGLLVHQWSEKSILWILPSPNDQKPYGRTNYTGVAGANGKDASTKDPNCCASDPPGYGANLAKYEGLFTNRSRNALTHVPDGTSNTLLFGEGVGGTMETGKQRDFAWAWMGVGMIATKFGLGQPGYPYGNSLKGSSWTNFSSRHERGVNFCFADGSVRLIPFGRTTQRHPTCSADWYMLQALAGFRDGAGGGD